MTLSDQLTDKSWREVLKDYFEYIDKIEAIIATSPEICLPRKDQVFTAFNLTPLNEVRVVLLGQDPYPNPRHAHGLSFSTESGDLPPSLRNLFFLLETQTPYKAPPNGNLTCWAKKGVLLLNTILTVDIGNSLSHATYGWQKFTDAVLNILKGRNVVFILLGNKAQEKMKLLENERVVCAPHPSPLNRKWRESTLFTDLEAMGVDFYH